jgi:hypothetical protein
VTGPGVKIDADGDRQNAEKVTRIHVLTEQDPIDAERLGDSGGALLRAL